MINNGNITTAREWDTTTHVDITIGISSTFASPGESALLFLPDQVYMYELE